MSGHLQANQQHWRMAGSMSFSDSFGISTHMKNSMATLEQFLRTGDLGPIHPGMTRAEVIACLGLPQDESVVCEPKILKYGALQLTFARREPGTEQCLILIAKYFGPHAG